MKPMENAQAGYASAAQDHGVDVKLSSVGELRAFGDGLFVQHALETEPDHAHQIAPNWPAYEDVEERGALIVIAAWDAGVLVGYAVAVLSHSMHYTGLLICQHDSLFVAPAYRGHHLASRMLDRLREQAKARGAHKLLLHAKPESRFGALLRLHGFEVEEEIFSETL